MKESAEVLTDNVTALKYELAREVLRSSGVLRLQVTGWSMLPTIWPGDELVIERVDCNRVSTGDIVLFGRDSRFFVHRVISKVDDHLSGGLGVITRGDGMPMPDRPVASSEVLGRVSLIRRSGGYVRPAASMSLFKSGLAIVVQRSVLASRILVRLRKFCEQPQERVVPCPN